MSFVAPQAQQGFALAQQVICDRAVWFMADRAVLDNRRMFIDKRALILRMAGKTDLIDLRLVEAGVLSAMHVVAACTAHFFLCNRMAGRQQMLRLFFLMAGKTEFWIFRECNLSRMRVVALRTGNSTHCMPAIAPRCTRVTAVAVEAYP